MTQRVGQHWSLGARAAISPADRRSPSRSETLSSHHALPRPGAGPAFVYSATLTCLAGAVNRRVFPRRRETAPSATTRPQVRGVRRTGCRGPTSPRPHLGERSIRARNEGYADLLEGSLGRTGSRSPCPSRKSRRLRPGRPTACSSSRPARRGSRGNASVAIVARIVAAVNQTRGSAAAAHRTHNPEVAGSIPAPATNTVGRLAIAKGRRAGGTAAAWTPVPASPLA